MRWGDRFAALAALLFVVGPLAHLAWHAPDHTHLPGGGIVWQPRATGAAHVHPHPHPHPAGVDDTPGEGSDPTAPDAPDDPPGAPPHGVGAFAHLGGAPVLTAPVLVPPRLVRLGALRVVATLPKPRRHRSRPAPLHRRARAPPDAISRAINA